GAGGAGAAATRAGGAVPDLLAGGAGSPGATVAEWLLVGTVFLAWLAFARLRNRAFLRLPRVLGWGSAGLAVGTLVLALVLFPLLSPGPNGSARPASTARLLVVSPRSGQVVRGNPAPVPVRLLLVGGRIVPFTSTHLVPNTG